MLLFLVLSCRRHAVAKDSSGKGNDLSLLSAPLRLDTEIKSGGNSMRTSLLSFKNNVALNKAFKGMPEKSYSLEFWARSKKLDADQPDMQQKFAQIFSYAAQHATDVQGGPDFMDDAIRIERWAASACDSSTSSSRGSGTWALCSGGSGSNSLQKQCCCIDHSLHMIPSVVSLYP